MVANVLDNVELNAVPAPMARSAIAVYRRDGFLRLKDFFSPKLIERHGLCVRLPGSQKINLWRDSEPVRDFVFGKRLAAFAAQLMSVERVRLFGDEVHCQLPGAKATEWRVGPAVEGISVWIPLQETALAMGPLAYAVASHLQRHPLDPARFQIDVAPYECGEVSFHSVRTTCRYGANRTAHPSWSFGVTYLAAGADEVVDEKLNPVLN